MANKRMFTMSIVDSDSFLDMPLSAQCLYFHLNMRADDDGFVNNPRRIMKTIGAADDDLKLLIMKSFLISFESGVIVIKHWRMHNTLGKSRYHETLYAEEKSVLMLKDNGAYSLSEGAPLDDSKLVGMFNDCTQRRTSGEQAENADKNSIDKNSIDKNSIDKNSIDKNSIDKNSIDKNSKYYFPDSPALDKAFKDYVDMRKKIKKPLTDRATELAIGKLNSLATRNGLFYQDEAIAILEQSTLNSWQGLFPLKEERKAVNSGAIDWSKV